MIQRFVKMTFKEAEMFTFLDLFSEVQDKIKQVEGCKSLKLLQDKNDPFTFFTFSTWESDEALQNYRKSSLFKDTWKETKKLFAEKPQAWSLITM